MTRMPGKKWLLAGLLACGCAPSGILNSKGNFVPDPHHALPIFSRSQEQRPDRWLERDERETSLCDFKYSTDGETVGMSCYDSTARVRRTVNRTYDTAGVYVFARTVEEVEAVGAAKRSVRSHCVSFLDSRSRSIVRETYDAFNRLRLREREFLDDSLRVRKVVGGPEGVDSTIYAYAGLLPLRKQSFKRGKLVRTETYVYSEQPKVERVEVCFTDSPACSHRRDVWYRYAE